MVHRNFYLWGLGLRGEFYSVVLMETPYGIATISQLVRLLYGKTRVARV